MYFTLTLVALIICGVNPITAFFLALLIEILLG